MAYTRKVTKKGQVTIPKEFRDEFGIGENTRVRITKNTDSNTVEISPAPEFFKLRDELDIKNPIDPVKAREIMENEYERL